MSCSDAQRPAEHALLDRQEVGATSRVCLLPFVKRQTIGTLTATAKSESVIALEEVLLKIDEEGKARELVAD